MSVAVLGILGQTQPAATTDTASYTVPASRRAVVSTIAICNTNASAVTYRVHARKAGAAVATSNAIAYDVSLAANATDMITIGVALATTDVIGVRASTTGVTFTIFGIEEDVV